MFTTFQARAALRARVPPQGVCLYPVMDYPGWRNDRHCRVGLIELDRSWRKRTFDAGLHERLQAKATLLRQVLGGVEARPG